MGYTLEIHCCSSDALQSNDPQHFEANALLWFSHKLNPKRAVYSRQFQSGCWYITAYITAFPKRGSFLWILTDRHITRYYLKSLFAHSFIHSFIHSWIHEFISLFIDSYLLSFLPSFLPSFIHSFVTYIHSYLYSIILFSFLLNSRCTLDFEFVYFVCVKFLFRRMCFF